MHSCASTSALQMQSVVKELELKTITDFGGWDLVQQQHFAEDGIFDQIYAR